MLLVDVRALEAAGLLVLADPFRPSVTVAMLVLALFFAVSAAVSAARDRESGTLEVLFYGPVDEITYVLGKAGGLLLAYLAALPLLLASLALLSWMSGFALTPAILVSVVLSIVPVAEIVGFGILLVGRHRPRPLGGAAAGRHRRVAARASRSPTAWCCWCRSRTRRARCCRCATRLRRSTAAASWISPFAWLERVVDGAMAGAWRNALLSLAAALAYAALMIGLAAVWLRHRGVWRRGE